MSPALPTSTTLSMSMAALVTPISARFGAAAATYDDQAQVQLTVAKRLMTTLVGDSSGSGYDRILEVGCGTGALTEMLSTSFPESFIHAVDIAPAMIEQASRRMGNSSRFRLQVADARELSSRVSFSLVVSSSALHWMVPLEATVRRLSSLLEPGGHLASALMVDGTFHELQASRMRVAPGKAAPIILPRAEEVARAHRAAGLSVVEHFEESLQARYDSARAFLRSLNEQGVTGALHGRERQILSRVELHRLIKDYDEHFGCPSGGARATSRVLYLRARKDRP